MSNDEEKYQATAFRALVHEHGGTLDRYLFIFERDAATRDELWADVMYLAHCHISELRSLQSTQVRAWLYRSARYLSANSSRRAMARRRMLKRLATEPIEHELSAEEEVLEVNDLAEATARNQRLESALRQLSERHQEVLILHALGKSGPQIARTLQITPQAARSRLMRARAAFAEIYESLPSKLASHQPLATELTKSEKESRNHG